ncbi:hypothetical protein ABZ745_35045 [Streptomyces sp. NPDC013082]|uniref:hypothetical protein n=1 Tax=Streptomyces sp. NPDC013082 TaxID=3156686 RepID=UPI0033CA0B9D
MTSPQEYGALTSGGSTHGQRTAADAAAGAPPAPRPQTVRTSFTSALPEALQRAFKVRCIALDTTIQEALDEAIREWLDAHPA